MTSLTTTLGRPASGEYAPYYDRYISLIASDDVIAMLEQHAPETIALFQSAGARTDHRYAPGKWSVKELLGHVNDTERIMAYRALRIARGDKTPIEGYEQDDYVRDGNFGQRTLADLIDEFMDIRKRRWRCSAPSTPNPPPAAVPPTSARSAFAPWPTSSPDMNCITVGFCKRNT